MIDIADIKIDASEWEITASRSATVTHYLLRNMINQIADEVAEKAKEFAPIGQPPPMGHSRHPGQLKADGIIKIDSEVAHIPGGDFGIPGSSVTDIPAFGGGFSVRGEGGRFVSATKDFDPGHIFQGGGFGSSYVTTAQVVLNPAVPHARWVHEGTGVYGPRHTPIRPQRAPYLRFWWRGSFHQRKSVRGQAPQPFLTEAFEYVNNIYTPAKLQQLRAELAAAI